MDTPTSDPGIVIEERTAGMVRYRSLSTGRRWEVHGECTRCGLCVIGAVPAERWVWTGPPGTPGAVTDTQYDARLDDPVTPEFDQHMKNQAASTPAATVAGCSLSFVVR